ncbi:MAG: hypothetical protein HFI25_09565 [Lachnospiraceae bacterium]|nr:hypothetical protein [Lachnospiraceae bacterium]
MKKTVKKNIQKKITLLTLASVMGLTLLGCGGTDSADAKPAAQEEQQEEQQENLDSKESEAPVNEDEQSKNAQENTDSQKQADGTGTQDAESPTGEITELGDGQFTIKKFYQETADDGGEILSSPAEGAEGDGGTDFDSMTVLCDENTRIYKRTIRDGGASYEDSESSFENLKKGMEVNLKGSYEGDAYRASEVQIVDVIL